MRDLLMKMIKKGLLTFTYVHHLLYEYITYIQQKQLLSRIQDMIPSLIENSLKLLSTKYGSKIMCCIITHASAKDRKQMTKLLKTHMLESLCHHAAFLSIMRLIDVTDDTVNIQKTLLQEISVLSSPNQYTADGILIPNQYPPLVKIITDRFGHKLILRLLNPNKRHLEPDEEEYLDLSVIVPTSKKTFEMRRKENLAYLKPTLLTLMIQNIELIMRSK